MDCRQSSRRRVCSSPPFAASGCTSGDLVPTHHGDQWPSPRTSPTGKLGSTYAPRLRRRLPSLLQKSWRTSAPPRRLSTCPARKMDEHLPGVSTRRDGRSSPMVEYREMARQMTEYRLVGASGRRDGGVQATGRRIGKGWCRRVTEQRGEGEGDLRQDCRVCVFSRL
jgi:hypothetical protein